MIRLIFTQYNWILFFRESGIKMGGMMIGFGRGEWRWEK